MDVMPTRFAKAGETVFSEGDDPDDGLFYICYGTVDISREEPDGTRSMAEMGEGAVFGEMALINSMPRNATVVAKEDCGFYNISREAFQHKVSQLDDDMRGVFQVFVLTIRDFLQQRGEWIKAMQELQDKADKVKDASDGGSLADGEGIKLNF